MRGFSRRSFVTGGAAAAIAIALRQRAFATGANPYRNAIVIDGLGGLGNSQTNGPLTDALVKDARDSGITCVHITMRPVGTTPPDNAFTSAVINIGQMESEIDAHALQHPRHQLLLRLARRTQPFQQHQLDETQWIDIRITQSY